MLMDVGLLGNQSANRPTGELSAANRGVYKDEWKKCASSHGLLLVLWVMNNLGFSSVQKNSITMLMFSSVFLIYTNNYWCQLCQQHKE